MNRRTLIAVALVAILASTPVLGLGSSAHQNTAIILKSQIIEQNHLNASYSSFTLYVPSSPFIRSAVQGILNSSGIHTYTGGSLWTFSVPSSSTPTINSTLSLLGKTFGVSYFTGGSDVSATPSIQPASGPYSTAIPFAYTPELISRAYNFTWALSHGINGSGQTIVIVDAYGDPNIAYDIKAFDSVNGLPPINLKIEYPYGTPGEYNATWAMETATDVEWAHALAPGANIVLLISTSAYISYLQQLVSYAAQNDLGNIMSLSWGTPESQIGASAVATYDRVYRQAASEGISIFAASGDNGAYDSTSSLTVNFPASDPYVTGVGGTSLYVLNNVFHQYGWGGVNNGQTYGSGGGYSSYFGTPYWQSVKGYSGSARGVPDVAMDADRYTGVYVVSGGGQYIVGGTSVATPMWADVAALIMQKNGVHLVSLNPLLYQIARTSLYNTSFTQITSGSNGYYNNTPYWNPVTGLGTPKVSGLINASSEILGGYGGIVLLNGTQNYMGTSIRATLNLTVEPSLLLGNGSTYYYVSLYLDKSNFVKFGVLAGYSGDSLMLEVDQSNKTVTSYFPMPSNYGVNLTEFLMELGYTGYSVVLSTSGGFTQNIPFFLNVSGSLVPAVGTEQTDSVMNISDINNGVFGNVATMYNGSWTPASYGYFSHYSSLASGNYSTIAASASAEGFVFHTSTTREPSVVLGTPATAPEIHYTLSFSSPITASFSLSGTRSQVSWSFNGTPVTGSSVQVPLSGGDYTINATYTDGSGHSAYVVRTLFIPGVMVSNISLNYSSTGYPHYPASVGVNWFYHYEITHSGKVPMLLGDNVVNATSYGFDYNNTVSHGVSDLNLTLYANPINVSVFSFAQNATVLINGNVSSQQGGYHFTSVLPDHPVYVNVSAPGFRPQNYSISADPGSNISFQAALEPLLSNSSLISGKVTDRLFSFPIENSLVRLAGYNGSYTNSTGMYMLYAPAGKYTLNATADLYDPFSTPVNFTSNVSFDIQLNPAKVTLKSTTPVLITHYFPLLFYLGFVSWNDYKGSNFSVYQIYVSNNDNFLNPSITSVTGQNTSYRFITGLVPGNTYYISVVLRLSNDQVYQSQVVKVTYGDPVYLGVNLIIVGAIGFYLYTGYRIFRRKK